MTPTTAQTNDGIAVETTRPHPEVEAWIAGGTTAKPRAMAIGISKVKYSASLSEETNAYTAVVLIDGVPAFDASNHGTGGADMYHRVKGYDGPDEREIDAWLKTNTPGVDCEEMTLDNSLELVVGELVEDDIRRKRLSRMLNTKIVIMDKHDGNDALFTYKGKPAPETLASMAKGIASGKIKGTLVNGADEATMAKARQLV